jgi:hypothetical protein
MTLIIPPVSKLGLNVGGQCVARVTRPWRPWKKPCSYEDVGASVALTGPGGTITLAREQDTPDPIFGLRQDIVYLADPSAAAAVARGATHTRCNAFALITP